MTEQTKRRLDTGSLGAVSASEKKVLIGENLELKKRVETLNKDVENLVTELSEFTAHKEAYRAKYETLVKELEVERGLNKEERLMYSAAMKTICDGLPAFVDDLIELDDKVVELKVLYYMQCRLTAIEGAINTNNRINKNIKKTVIDMLALMATNLERQRITMMGD